MQNKYEALFSPIKIGGVTLKNRVILTAMGGTSFLGYDGKVNPGIRDYYMARVKGGVGLIVPGVTGVKSAHGYLYEKEAEFLGPIHEIIDEIHACGAKYFFQLGAGFGRAQLIGLGGAMGKIQSFAGVTGNMKFTPDGDPVKDAVVVRVTKEGEFEFVKSLQP